MSTYEALLAIHIVAAVVWVGGSLMLQILAVRATNANDPGVLARFFADVGAVGNKTFIPASLVLVVTGFLIIAEVDYSYEFWVIFGLAVWAASFVTGAGFLGPEAGRTAQVLEERGPADPEFKRRLTRILTISRIELLFLFLVVIDMAIKPGAAG